MKKNRVKRSIYVRIFGIFLVLYLVLMIGFSAFMVAVEKRTVDMELASFSTHISNRVVEIFEGNIDSNNQITNLSEIKKGFVNKPIDAYIPVRNEYALFTSDYELIYNSNDYWLIGYSKVDGTKHISRYALLNPNTWFSEEEIKELEEYRDANSKAEKSGDLVGYDLNIYGFWMDEEMVIPENIYITPMYASSFNEDGDVVSSTGTRQNDPVYSSGYEDREDLPYYEFARIIQDHHSVNPNNEGQEELRQMVLDVSNLKRLTENCLERLIFNGRAISERANGLTYHYYMPVPYESMIEVMDDGSLYSDYWTVVAMSFNIGERIHSTLIYVWTACLFIFFIAAYILSRQTYKTYVRQGKLERQRKEMTDALAHDLKTPLSIISGYAQNLEENVHSEKRDHYASHININVNRMDKIIGKMLEMSKLESDSFDLKLEEISLEKISKNVINRYSQLCDEKSISISLDGDALIKADKSLIDRVIDNFIINAIENTPKDGRISIRILDDRLEVYNSGSHIAEDKIKEVWYPYKKVDAERSNTKGTGLGLSISRTILELHGFSYGAENSEDGVIFCFKW